MKRIVETGNVYVFVAAFGLAAFGWAQLDQQKDNSKQVSMDTAVGHETKPSHSAPQERAIEMQRNHAPLDGLGPVREEVHQLKPDIATLVEHQSPTQEALESLGGISNRPSTSSSSDNAETATP